MSFRAAMRRGLIDAALRVLLVIAVATVAVTCVWHLRWAP